VLSGVSGRKDTHYEHYQLWPVGPAGIRFELRHVLRKHLHSPLAYRVVMLLATVPIFPFMLIEKLLRPVENSWSWWFSAYLKGRSLARQREFDLIYSTGGAFAAHIAGKALKFALGTPWVAEVHDPMVVPGTVPHNPQQIMQAMVEANICAHANVAIWFTQAALDSAKRRHPVLAARGQMILPGVDEPAYVLSPYVRGAKMVIGHFGSLSPSRNLASTVDALDALQERYPEMRGVIELHVYGGPLDSISAIAVANAKYSCTRHFGRLESDLETGKSGREQILQCMRSSDLLLLLHGQEPICAEYIPSKMYEYLWMQRPILAIVHNNEQMADLLRAKGHMVVADRNALLMALEDSADAWMSHGLSDSGLKSHLTTHNAVQRILELLR
jgi:glycosyltransferase involved in cell wall biosynthesis